MENVSDTYPGTQHDSLELFAKNGGTKNAELIQISRKSWEFYLGRESRLLLKIYQGISIEGRLGISAPEKLVRMETVPCNFQQNIPNIGEETRNRPVCFKVVISASKLHPKQDANSPGTYSLQQKWYHKSLYAVPPFALNHKVLKKVEEDKAHSLIIVTPTWQTQS